MSNSAPARRPQRLAAVSLVALALLGAVWLATHPPSAHGLLRCSFHAVTGLWCPGCGAGRALYCLLHGRLAWAVRCHPLLVLALPWLAWGAWGVVRELWTGRRRPVRAWPGWAGWTALVLLLAFWVLRNLPVWPCTLLAPPPFEVVGHL